MKRGLFLLLASAISGASLLAQHSDAKWTSEIRTTTAATGVVKGQVTDAGNGMRLSNVNVSIAGFSTVTDQQGNYVFTGVPVGTITADFIADRTQGDSPLRVQFFDQSSERTRTLTANASGYVNYVNTQVLVIPNDTSRINFSMTSVLAAGLVRFVLNWGATPYDLDSYLKTPLINNVQYVVYYGARGSSVAVPFDTLDHDVTSGYGPETMTMYKFYPGTYHYYIHNYSGTPEIATSDATVQIYTGAQLLNTLHIPTTGTGPYWHVCDVDGTTKEITFINQIVAQPPGNITIDPSSSIKKTDTTVSVVRIASPDSLRSWLWNFGDGTSSSLRNPSHTYELNGSYTVSLSVTGDSGSTSQTKPNYISVGPVALVNFTGDSLIGSNQQIQVTPPSGLQVLRATLYYRKGGRLTYDSLGLDTTRIPFVGSIPSSVVTLRGLEYYVAISGISSLGPVTVTAPLTNPESNPIRQQVRATSVLSPVQQEARVYKMISVPADLDHSTIRDVLVDDLGEYDPLKWRLFRWEGNAYKEFPLLNQNFSPGTAFWLITNDGHAFDVDSSRSMSTASGFSVVLDTGWNQIGNPFAFQIRWSSVSVQGRVKGPYHFNGTDYELDTLGFIQPWEGYFVLNEDESPVSLIFPPVESDTLNSNLTKPRLAGEFELSLSAEILGTSLRDDQNVVGFLDAATESNDAFDFPEPPAIRDNVRLSIVDAGKKYMRNFKPAGNGGQEWDIEIASPFASKKVTVHFTRNGILPDGYKVFVLDKENFNTVPVDGNSFSVDVAAANSARTYRLLIGTEEFARNNNDGIPLTPFEYSLEQNYPNPFNPVTTITYQLNKRGIVTLEVYNLLGQRIKTLVQGEELTGRHSIRWSGDNDAGSRVSSGVYFYRMYSGGFVASRKLVLIH